MNIHNADLYADSLINLNDCFYKYLDFLELLCCKRCWNKSNNINTKVEEGRKFVHHKGGLLYLLSQNPKINYDQFNKWVGDLEHGFFHGLCTGFWSFLQIEKDETIYDKVVDNSHDGRGAREKDLDIEKLFYSCLFHDYYRCVNSDEKHDEKLIEFFPNCIESTYYHSDPPEKQKDNCLIVSDRIELNRFQEKSWIDWNKLNQSDFIAQNILFIEMFYQSLYNCLKYIFSNRKDLWVKHVSEDIFINEKIKHLNFYPEKYWEPRDNEIDITKFGDYEKKYASIDMDYLPLSNCHANSLTEVTWLKGITGLITKKDVINLGAKIKNSSDSTRGRDHPFLVQEKKILTKNWIFAFNTKYDLESIDCTKENTIKVKVVDKFYNIVNLLLGKIEGLKVE
jgi:hypothetical protein